MQSNHNTYCYHVKLSYTILLHRERQRNSVLLDEHFSRGQIHSDDVFFWKAKEKEIKEKVHRNNNWLSTIKDFFIKFIKLRDFILHKVY